MVSIPTQSDDLPTSSLENFHVWKLEDAKACFSEVVCLVRDSKLQLVTVRGEDAVVIFFPAQTFAKLLPWIEQPSLHALLCQTPLSRSSRTFRLL